ncbi:MAG: hypothetical protein P8Y24_09190, partial [Gammaproteobacteria bacterium]
MKHILSITIVTFLLFTLASCSSYKVSKISDIEDIDSNIRDNIAIDVSKLSISEDVVIQKYKGLIKEQLTDKNKRHVIRRYGDLLIDKGERLVVSENANSYQAGKEMIGDSINTYKIYIQQFPSDTTNDYIYYQIARGYELIERPDIAYQYLTYLTNNYKNSDYYQEAQFRRGEFLFVKHQFVKSGYAYQSILSEKYQNSKLYDKTLYKYAWVNFKLERYSNTVNLFTRLLDKYYTSNMISDYEITDKADKGNIASIKDILRATSLSFSYMGGSENIKEYTQGKAYTPLLYDSLARMYQSKKRYYDAINTYNKFINSNKNSRHAYKFHQSIITLYKTAGMADSIVPEKVKFINNFG